MLSRRIELRGRTIIRPRRAGAHGGHARRARQRLASRVPQHFPMAADGPAAEPSYALHRGEIAGALFTLAVPSRWCGDVLLFAHGCRPVGIPLVADLRVDSFYKQLLREGFIVGMSSYRREGLIVRDAMADMDNLRAHLVQTFGPTRRVFLEGSSMGGAITVHMSESADLAPHYAGAILDCAALLARDADAPLEHNFRPLFPLVFLSNADEAPQAADYIAACAEQRRTGGFVSDVPPPVLRVVYRNGHCNTNAAERAAAFALLNALDGAPETGDGTVVLDPGPSTAIWDDEGCYCAVRECDAWGDMYTTLLPDDLARIGLRPGSAVRIAFNKLPVMLDSGESAETCRLIVATYAGNSFVSVAPGAFLLFDGADGCCVLSANGYAIKALAAEICGAVPGSVFQVLRPIGAGAALRGIPGGVDGARAALFGGR